MAPAAVQRRAAHGMAGALLREGLTWYGFEHINHFPIEQTSAVFAVASDNRFVEL